MFIEDYILTFRRCPRYGYNSLDLNSAEHFDNLSGLEPIDQRNFIYSICRGPVAIADIEHRDGEWQIAIIGISIDAYDKDRVRNFLKKAKSVSS